MKWEPGPLFSAQGLFTAGLCGLWGAGHLSLPVVGTLEALAVGSWRGSLSGAPAQPLHTAAPPGRGTARGVSAGGTRTPLPRSCKQPRLHLGRWKGFLILRKSGPRQFLTWGASSLKVSGPSNMPKSPTFYAARQLHPHKIRVKKNVDSRYMGICQLLSILFHSNSKTDNWICDKASFLDVSPYRGSLLNKHLFPAIQTLQFKKFTIS